MKPGFAERTASLLVRLFAYPAEPLSEYKTGKYVEKILLNRGMYLESAENFGTPQYFYDEASLEASVDKFYKTFKRHIDRFRLFYAMKSNHLPELARKVSGMGHGLDVSSGTELKNALSAGCGSVIFSGPGKRDEELELFRTNSDKVTIMLDSPGEYERLKCLLKRDNATHRCRIRAGIRIRNPRRKYWNKFGIPLEDLGYFLERINTDDLMDAAGLQFHTSWNLGPESQVRLIDDIAGHLQDRIPKAHLANFRFFDIGGGYWPDTGEWLNPENTGAGKLIRTIFHGIQFDNRHYYNKSRGLESFADAISRKIKSWDHILKGLEIWAEPGRWISTGSMHILLKVIDIKGADTAVTDGGINILGWERPLTEYIPVINLTNPAAAEKNITVYGPLCTPDDIWGKALFGKSIKNDDVIIIPDQGAYTYSLRQAFIKPIPKIVRHDGKKAEIIRGEKEFLSC